MFVRFPKYELKKGGTILRAELVESFRDPRTGGEPRNRFLSYLGSISEGDCSNPVAQVRFWRGVDARLARLHLSDDDKQVVREKVQARIPQKSWSDIVDYISKFSHRRY
jgi:hypothetical protein